MKSDQQELFMIKMLCFDVLGFKIFSGYQFAILYFIKDEQELNLIWVGGFQRWAWEPAVGRKTPTEEDQQKSK